MDLLPLGHRLPLRVADPLRAEVGAAARPDPRPTPSDVARRRRAPRALFVAAALAGIAVVAVAFWPGTLDLDGLAQLAEARRHRYTDAHPPLVAWLWHWLDLALPGPAPMLLLQNVLFWSGVSLACALAWPSWRGAAAGIAIGFWPPVFAQLGTIWKDVLMAGALALATALVLLAGEPRGGADAGRARRGALVGGALLLVVASGVRHNGFTAAAPLAVWWGLVACRGGRRTRALGAAAGVALAALVAWAGRATNAALADDPGPDLAQMVFVHQLTGLSIATGADELPGWVAQIPNGRTTAQLRARFDPLTLNSLYFGPDRMDLTTEREEVDELRRRWLDAIRAHPREYLAMRGAYLARLLGIRGDVWYPFADPVDLGVGPPSSPRHAAVLRALHRIGQGPLFRGWLHLAAGAALLAAAAWTRTARAGTVALAASAACYVAPFFVVGPAPDFRYLLWPIVAVLLLPATLRPRARG